MQFMPTTRVLLQHPDLTSQICALCDLVAMKTEI